MRLLRKQYLDAATSMLAGIDEMSMVNWLRPPKSLCRGLTTTNIDQWGKEQNSQCKELAERRNGEEMGGKLAYGS